MRSPHGIAQSLLNALPKGVHPLGLYLKDDRGGHLMRWYDRPHALFPSQCHQEECDCSAGDNRDLHMLHSVAVKLKQGHVRTGEI